MFSAAPEHHQADNSEVVFVDYDDLKDSINFSLNPCENFFEFVCDGWLQKNPIPEDKSAISHFLVRANKKYYISKFLF